MAAPIIGISAPRSAENSAFGVRDSVLQVMEYADAVVAAGGRPVLLPPTEVIPDEPLAGIDGLVLSGGGDLSPAIFGREAVEASYGISEVRDAYEMALVKDAEARSIPILAICRGLQLVNVLRGGTLHMHIDDHWQSEPSDSFAHEVTLTEGSALADLVGSTKLMVNSYHHQAIDTLGDRLVPVGFSDHVVEAFVADDADIVGVQWHPEHLYKVSPENHALFKQLVQKASSKQERLRS